MTIPSDSYILPDLRSFCPWNASLNPHHTAAAGVSSEWIFSYDIFKHITNQEKRDFFLKQGSELLCAYVYPYAAPELLRTACDWVNLLFIIDDTTAVVAVALLQQ